MVSSKDVTIFTGISRDFNLTLNNDKRFLDGLKTIDLAMKHGFNVVCLYKGLDEESASFIKKYKYIYFEQKSSLNIGNLFEESLSVAVSVSDSRYYVWLEVYKYYLLGEVLPTISKMISNNVDLGLFYRVNFINYPISLSIHYKFTRIIGFLLFGEKVDYGFGPFVISKNITNEFIDCKSKNYTNWNRFLVPRLNYILKGNYINHKIIKAIDKNTVYENDKFKISSLLKRIRQSSCITVAFIKFKFGFGGK